MMEEDRLEQPQEELPADDLQEEESAIVDPAAEESVDWEETAEQEPESRPGEFNAPRRHGRR